MLPQQESKLFLGKKKKKKKKKETNKQTNKQTQTLYLSVLLFLILTFCSGRRLRGTAGSVDKLSNSQGASPLDSSPVSGSPSNIPPPPDTRGRGAGVRSATTLDHTLVSECSGQPNLIVDYGKQGLRQSDVAVTGLFSLYQNVFFAGTHFLFVGRIPDMGCKIVAVLRMPDPNRQAYRAMIFSKLIWNFFFLFFFFFIFFVCFKARHV